MILTELQERRLKGMATDIRYSSNVVYSVSLYSKSNPWRFNRPVTIRF